MKIFILYLSLLSILYGFSKQELIQIYENNFSANENVKIINNYYFILSSDVIYKFNKRVNMERLRLKSKSLLLSFLQNKFKNTKSFTLKELSQGMYWKKENKYYLFSFIKKSNIILNK